MSTEILAFEDIRQMGECATHPIARLARRLAALRINAGSDHAASSRLARQRARRTLGRVQLRFLGLFHRGRELNSSLARMFCECA
jgi:hypothetical protein